MAKTYYPALPPGLPPRALTRELAAAYCSLSPDAFSQWVSKGRLPGPIPGTKRWDRHALDFALDQASGMNGTVDAVSAYDSWKAASG